MTKLKFIVFCLLLFLAGLWLCVYIFSDFLAKNELKLEIITEEERIVWPMSKDGQIPIKTKEGNLIVVVERNQAFVKESSCPDKICVKSGRISKNRQLLMCAPNRVMVKIVHQRSKIRGALLSY